MKNRSTYFLMPLLALAGASCASDNHEPGSPSSVKSAWIAMDIVEGSNTRGFDVIDDATDPTSLITQVNVYLTDENDGIIAVGIGSLDSKKYESDRKKISLKASIDATAPLEKGTSYRLRVVANGSMLNSLSRAALNQDPADHQNLLWNYTASGFNNFSKKGLPQNVMPMATAGDDYAMVTIDPDKGTENNPYTATGEVKLTRMMSAIDYDPGTKANKYKVSHHDLNVKFLAMQPVNVAGATYLLQRASSAGLVETPIQSTWHAALPAAYTSVTTALSNVVAPIYEMQEKDLKTICYVTENVPSKNNVTLGNATGLIFIAKLEATSDTPKTIADCINSTSDNHPTLAYFDDGTYQSGLELYVSAKHTDPNWHLVKWETIKVGDKEVSGYIVRYIKPIRHGGINSDTLDDNGIDKAPAAASDGICDDMEYATVRGFRYVVRIADVSFLPHLYNPDDSPEDGKGDLDVQMYLPKSWTYHRRVDKLDNL